ncbi:MAG: DUF1648 domain-containing protein [Chitinophagales bacterium]|nr:DUF1648 domain-containing protein [Chitinophagaceae bacterium]MCB9063865.1 DUF1648 domain-containing protein [Chitinophagales bacterium]
MAYSLSKSERYAEVISALLLIALIGGTIFSYVRMPEMIPTGLNEMGAPDHYENRYILLMFPLLGVILFLSISFINFFLIKYRDNTIEGRQPQHAGIVWLLRMAKLVIMSGLAISVMEIVRAVYLDNSFVSDSVFVCEGILAAFVFLFVLMHVIDRLRSPQMR